MLEIWIEQLMIINVIQITIKNFLIEKYEI